MRDIRQDLEERLESATKERMELQSKLVVVMGIENGLKVLLQREQERWSRITPPLFEEQEIERTALSQIIVSALKDSPGHSLGLDDLKEAATKAGYDFGEKSPGRSIHFALVGMQQGKIVDKREDGSWVLMQ